MHGGRSRSGDAVRHSGDVRVRGRYVRRWRPRHLELSGDGTLHYYEAETDKNEAAADTAAAEAEASTKLPEVASESGATTATEAAAATTNADPIGGDVTSSNEIFDGWQTLSRTDILPDDDKKPATNRKSIDSSSSQSDKAMDQNIDHTQTNSYGDRPKSILIILHARAIDPTSMKDIHVGLPTGKAGFMFRARRKYSSASVPLDDRTITSRSTDGTGVKESRDVARDYFCYVPTAEARDAWIAALRWAATMTKISHRATLHGVIVSSPPRTARTREPSPASDRDTFKEPSKLNDEQDSYVASSLYTQYGRLASLVIGTSSICLARPVSRWYQSIAIPVITIRADVFTGIVISATIAGGMIYRRFPWLLLPAPMEGTNAADDDDDSTGDASLIDEDEITLPCSTSAEEVGEVASVESPAKPPRVVTNPLQCINSSESRNCWSEPPHNLFKVRGATYLNDRVKVESSQPAFACRGVELWLLGSSDDMPQRQIARHPALLNETLGAENTFLVNFLLPFGNLVAYFKVPDVSEMKQSVRKVWERFLNGDQAFRDSQLKMLPVLQHGPWIVQKAVGPGNAPALLGKVVPCQYYFRVDPSTEKSISEVDIHISGSKVASAILNVVRGHTKGLRIAFAFILEGKEVDELPETVLCAFALNKLEIELCQPLPPMPDEEDDDNVGSGMD